MGGAASVNLKEIDISTRVASFEGVYGAIVVPAAKGPTVPSLVTSDTQFLNRYTPDGNVDVGYDLSYFSALGYLERANKLWVQRVINGAIFGGAIISDGSAEFAKFNAVVPGVTGNVELIANVAGVAGNSIVLTGDGIKDLDLLVSDWNTANVGNEVTLNSANGADVPNNTEVMTLTGGSVAGSNVALSGQSIVDPTAYLFDTDEILLIYGANEGKWSNDIGIKITTVVDDPDLIEPNSFLLEVFKVANQAVPVESFLVSRVLGQKNGRGLNMFIEDVLESSNYVRAISNVTITDTTLPLTQAAFLQFGDGSDGLAVTDANMVTGINEFANKAKVNLTILMDGGYAVPAFQSAMDVIAQNRGDCVAILSVPYSNEVSANYMTDIVAYRKTTLNLNTSYSAIYSPHLQILDRFNNRNIWIAPDGHIGGSISFSAQNFEIWFPPAGFKRGLLNVLDTRVRFSDGELDTLQNAQINPIRFIPGEGIVVWGQRTLLARASALDRLNVRLMLIVIKPAIKKLLEDYLFDINDANAGSVIETKIESYLETIKAKKGITDFDVVSDSSNNTQEDEDNNRRNVDIFLKPAKSIEDIPVRVVITPSNISFSDAAGAI